MNLPRHLLAAFFTTIILVGCDSKESSQLKEVTYEPTSQPSPTEKAEVIGDALGIAEPMPSIDSDGQELLGVRSPQLLYSDAGLMVALQGKVTVADGAQTNKTLWRQVSGPAAQILNASQKQAEVIIPQVAKITDLEFAFAAADTSNRVAEARTRIRVSPLEFLGIIAQSTAVVSTGLVTITLSLPKPPEAAVILQYRTQDGSALAGRDYESAQGQVTLTQENPKATIEITALNSDVASGDLYFILNYSVGPTGPWSSIYVALPAEREGSVPSEPPGSNLSSSSNSSSSTSSGSASTSSSSSSSSTSSSSSASSSTSSSSSSSSNSSSSGLSLVIPTNQNRKIAAGPNHAVAIKADGSVLAWGRNEHRQCQVPEGLKDVISVAAGDYHNMALTADGTVVAWGANGSIFSTKAGAMVISGV